MSLLRRAPKVVKSPVWRLEISPGIAHDYEQVIDGVSVTFDKTCWTWNLLRDDLRHGQLWDLGPTATKEEALEVGLQKLREVRGTSDRP